MLVTRLFGFVWLKRPFLRTVLEVHREIRVLNIECQGGLQLVRQFAGFLLMESPGGVFRRPRNGCGSKPMVPFWGMCTTGVHWGYLYGILTHGQMTLKVNFPSEGNGDSLNFPCRIF